MKEVHMAEGQNVLKQIEEGMKPFSVVVSQREGYIRVWNGYCGGIMIEYGRKLDAVCASLGLKYTRKRTYGDGRILAADWEDQLRPIQGGGM
jgi:hypothetical protein